MGPGGWINQLFPELVDQDPIIDLLHEITAWTRNSLDAEEISFTPLLPDDDAGFGICGQALGRWCSGFLSGLGLAGIDKSQPLPGEVVEAIEDFERASRELAKVDENMIGSEEDNADLFEIVEYVRIAVLTIAAERQQQAG